MKNFDLQTYKEELINFSGEKVHQDRFVTLYLTLGTQPRTRTVKVDFLVIDYPPAYNVILGKLTLNKIRAIVSTLYLTMKFFMDKREIATVRVAQVVACKCYNVSLEVTKRKKEEKEEV